MGLLIFSGLSAQVAGQQQLCDNRGYMFTSGFYKVAVTLKSNITPEEYYDLKAEKDPYLGAVVGSVAGAAYGGLKGRTARSALKWAALGGGAGASAGYLTGKTNKAIRLKLLKNEIDSLKLKASPGRHDYHQANHGEG